MRARHFPAEEQSRDRSHSAVALAQFSVLWAAAALFHIASGNEWRTAWLPGVAAAWVLVQPGRILPLATLALSQVWMTFIQAPFIANHVLLTALINASMFLVFVPWPNGGRQAHSPGAFFDEWSPAVRAALIGMYFFAVFHKLNRDFFDPAVSCGAVFYAQELARFTFLPATPAMFIGSIYATFLIEAAILVLLLFRRTQNFGVLLGAMFHWLLAIHPRDGFYNFSSMLLAVFYLFVADVIVARTTDLSRIWLPRLARGFLAAVALLAVAQQSGVAERIGVREPFLYLWIAYGLALVAGYIVVMQRAVPATTTGYRYRPRPIMAALPIVVVLNGLSPYVGLKTETSWAMFSNLKTEGGQSNHWLVPASLQVFDFQRDLVELVEASDQGLQAVANEGFSIPYFEVRRKPWMAIAYRQNGEMYRYHTVAEDPRFPGEIPWLLRKALSFRPVNPSSHQRCVH